MVIYIKLVIYSVYLYSNHNNYDRLNTMKEFILFSEKLQKQAPELFYKKTVLKNFAIFTGKYLFWSLFLIGLQLF